MTAGLATAASRFSVTLEGPVQWGYEDKTVHAPTTNDQWLRLLCLPAERWAKNNWRASLEADEQLPAAVPRPRIHRCDGWLGDAWGFRSELYERVKHEVISAGPLLLDGDPELPDSWWMRLRTSLATVSTVRTERLTMRPERLEWALPKFLDAPDLNTRVPAWDTAHGDLHWANLTGPELTLLDWERWGRAPLGYDAATLYVSSLTAPATAARVRREFADLLDTDAGRFAELVVASEYLQGMERGNNRELEAPLRARVGELLARGR